MAVHNYARNAETARRLIEKYGRTVEIHRKPLTPVDAAKPWKGPNPATPTLIASPKAVIYPMSAESANGTLILLGDEYALIADTALSPTQDLKDIDHLTDGTTVYKVINASTIGPGDIRICYQFHVRR